MVLLRVLREAISAVTCGSIGLNRVVTATLFISTCDNLLVVLPLIVNAVLLPIELTISFIWLILYKTHIAGGGH